MTPSRESDRVLVEHMLGCIDAIQKFLANEPNRYRESRLVHDACLRNLQTLTESSQRLSDALKHSAPEIPWRSLSGFRNLLVHDYLGGIDDAAVAVVLERDLPALRGALERMKHRLQIEQH